MKINTNIAALQAQRALGEHSKQIENSSGKLSSGMRVRSAADDAAGLAMGLKQQTYIRSQGAALRNANDAVSEFQVAEGSLNEVNNMLVRLKELSLQSSTGTIQDNERGMLNAEYMQLRREIERVIQSTRFNGEQLFRSGGSREFQVGIHNNDNSKLKSDSGEIVLSEFNLKIVDSEVATQEDARLNLGYLNQAMEKVSSTRAHLGAHQNQLESTINNLDISKQNQSAAFSRSMETDYAWETSQKVQAEIKLSAATSVMAQSNNFGAMALKLLQN